MKGNLLLEACSKPKSNPAYEAYSAMCTGYVLGVVDQHEFSAGALGGRRQFCLKEGATADRMVELTREWLAAHPDGQTSYGSFGVLVALKQAYPCK
jgi:hypothetical protein